MASTDKTSILGLSKWRGSDKPKRVDFVSDNDIIDSRLGGHINNAEVHLTAENALQLGEPVHVRTVTGTGSAERSVVLDFEPRAVVVFAVGKAPAVPSGSNLKIYSAFAVPDKTSAGVELYRDEVRLLQSTAASGGVQNCLNETGVSYVVMAFR